MARVRALDPLTAGPRGTRSKLAEGEVMGRELVTNAVRHVCPLVEPRAACRGGTGHFLDLKSCSVRRV